MRKFVRTLCGRHRGVRETGFQLVAVMKETNRDQAAGALTASKSWSFDTNRLGNCELRDGASLTLFSDGRYPEWFPESSTSRKSWVSRERSLI